MTTLLILAGICVGVGIERKRVARQPIVISRMPTQLERDPLDTPAITRRQRVARELVFGKGRVIEADATEVGRG